MLRTELWEPYACPLRAMTQKCGLSVPRLSLRVTLVTAWMACRALYKPDTETNAAPGPLAEAPKLPQFAVLSGEG